MKTLNHTNICHGSRFGSNTDKLKYSLAHESANGTTWMLRRSLLYKCKTRPWRYAARCAGLIGLVYDQFDGDEKLLDIVVDAINLANASFIVKARIEP